MPRTPYASLPVALGAALSMVACSSGSSGTASHDSGAQEAASPVSRTDASDAARDSGARHDSGGTGHVDASAPATDAAPDVDNGAPSTSYPAPHPALPQLTNLAGGPILKTPKIYLVFYPGYPYVSDLETFATKMSQASFWGAITSQYGVGAITVGGTITLTGETPPSSISSTDLQTWVGTELQSGKLGTPDPEGIYTVVFPSTTVVTMPNPIVPTLAPVQSCQAFGGYHDNATIALTDGGAAVNYSYAIIPTCDTVVDDLTAVISHEWIEAATDPFLTAGGAFALTGGPDSAFFSVDADHAVWALLGGGEAGDLCESEGNNAYVTPPDIGYTVQRSWSNLLASQSHDPCAPDIAGQAYFNSAPVLPETVSFTTSLTGTIVTQGVTIPAGTSKTIEVDLFRDADTGGPWTVTADDLLFKEYGSYGLPNTLSFAWDRTQGVNGEKLHLTITVTKESIFNGGHAFMITSTQGTRQVVWPGLIVE